MKTKSQNIDFCALGWEPWARSFTCLSQSRCHHDPRSIVEPWP